MTHDLRGLSEHAEQVLRVGQLGDQRDALAQAQLERALVHEAQRRIVLQCEADRVEHRDFLGVAAAGLLALQHFPQLGDGKVGRHLLDLSLDARLRRELDEHAGLVQDVGVQLGLARAVAADRVDVHARLDREA